MNKVLLILVLVSCTSCAYKARLLTKSNDKSNLATGCFLLANNVNNIQNIYHVIDNGWQEYEGQKELSFTYQLNEFLSQNGSNCYNEIVFEISEIESNELHYSDTGSNAHGFKIKTTVNFIIGGNKVKQQSYEIEHKGDYYSTLRATKKRIDKEMVVVMNAVFSELKKQLIDTASSL